MLFPYERLQLVDREVAKLIGANVVEPGRGMPYSTHVAYRLPLENEHGAGVGSVQIEIDFATLRDKEIDELAELVVDMLRIRVVDQYSALRLAKAKLNMQ